MAELIFLIGYRAVGKTTIGRQLAAQLGYDFVDSDIMICENKGQTVAEIVAAEGWAGFRAAEAAVLASLVQRRRCVVATGGGAILHQALWKELKQTGVVVWLRAEQDVICSRIMGDEATAGQRPSLTGGGICSEVVTVLAEREPLYQKLADLTVDSGCMTPQQAMMQIVDFVSQDG
ncbi:MAG: shikimate kinase AroL [Desulfobulbaceae bacterium]|uniref:Shikimate kinase n=1 Tax=Candidatus Desulfatifera sulfidica TaxID=2841691 RepID=A0A8J6NCV1_9BACT|nr:shikimate kinase AroL [Candidatus Desulfatifera sulfidica]